ncbi:Transglutaminase domain-containing protein [metagenome]|uniref:Transglutaminase domain-containing protein n=1 Tax=metagenome TaxID=256318 RepID=A0A2P2CC14_9ZZZZ
MSADRPEAARTYEVRHRTHYRYDKVVTGSYGRTHLTPRDLPTQSCASARLEIEPTPDLTSSHIDHFGNASHYVEVRSPHTELVITSISTVTVHRPVPDLARLDEWTVGSAAAAHSQAADRLDAVTYALPSRLVTLTPSVAAYAGSILGTDRPLGEALAALVHGIHDGFTYESGATSVSTTLDELLEDRAGVCQDFAHLAIGCLRSVGLPARYVSGYLETRPPAGTPRLQGADASHAWLSVLAPDGEWYDLDPTNDQQPDSRYVVAAWGRDYRDVTPMKGVIFTQGKKSTLDVGVDVIRLGDALPGL